MNRLLVSVTFLCVSTSVALVLIPAVLIRPFAPQTPSDLEVSYLLRYHNRWLTLMLLLIGLSSVLVLWQTMRRRLAHVLLTSSCILLGGFAVLSWQNHFEWMFHPMKQEGFTSAEKASHVQSSDMVLAVEAHGDSKAFPVPAMAYHHLVNTQVGGEPIVATY